VSGCWAATLWWIDQLGLLALKGQRVQCRQTLCGTTDYSLISDEKGNYGEPSTN
jgi:hypothetical protein